MLVDNNQTVRYMFNDYYEKAFKPNLRLVADEIGIDYSYLIKFKNGHKDLSQKSLLKILNHIHKANQTA